MKEHVHKVTITRDGILSLLSDAEIAKVSTVESAAALVIGDEYVDLVHLEQGIRRATMSPINMHNLVARKAVHEDTWGKIVALMKHSPAAAAPPLS